MLVPAKLTSEVLLSTPSRSPAVPNHDGNLALYTTSTHTFGQGTANELHVMTLETGSSRLVSSSDSVHDANWLGDGTNAIVFLEDGEAGITHVKLVDADDLCCGSNPILVGTFPAPVQGLRVKPSGGGALAITVVGLAGEDGGLYNKTTAEKKATTGRVYDNFRVRVWKWYKGPQKCSIFYSQLIRVDGSWKLATRLHNAVANDGTLDDCPDGMYSGALGNSAAMYDLSERGIVFITLDPETFHQPKYSKVSAVYYVPIPDFSAPVTASPRRLATTGSVAEHGWFKQVSFSPDGASVAFSKMFYHDQVETRLFLAEIDGDAGAVDVAKDITQTKWDVFPSSFGLVSGETTTIYFQANDVGRVALYKVDLRRGATPELILRDGAVSAFYYLKTNTLLVSSSSMLDSSTYRLIDPSRQRPTRVVSSVTKNGALVGISSDQISELYFDGDGGHPIHAFMATPKNLDRNKKYPLALLIHGGPAWAWRDEWLSRWCLPLWAEQGYVVVAPNITGSIGYGYEHTARIHNNWAGSPYQDLAKCLDFLKQVPYIDLDNAVAAGESYGGDIINWIQGHELGRKFKALTTIDGVYSLKSSMVDTDAPLGGPDFNGPNYPWVNVQEVEKWDPSRPELLRNWTTPALVVHNDRDYRLPITHGLSAFTTLQMKGTPSRFLHFPDEGHFVEKPDNLVQFYHVIFDWMGRYSGAKPTE